MTQSNAFVAFCKYEENVKSMTFKNCDLFKRSFTTEGMGFTFNNEVDKKLIKENYISTEFSHNDKRQPSLMKSTKIKHSLQVVIERNVEDVSKEIGNYGWVPKQKYISVSFWNQW